MRKMRRVIELRRGGADRGDRFNLAAYVTERDRRASADEAKVELIKETVSQALQQTLPLMRLAHMKETETASRTTRREAGQRGGLSGESPRKQRPTLHALRRSGQTRGEPNGPETNRRGGPTHKDQGEHLIEQEMALGTPERLLLELVPWYGSYAKLAAKSDHQYVQLNAYYDNIWQLARNKTARGLALYKHLGKSRKFMTKGKVLLSSKYGFAHSAQAVPGKALLMTSQHTANETFVYFHASAINAALSVDNPGNEGSWVGGSQVAFSDTKAALLALHHFGEGRDFNIDRLPERINVEFVDAALDRLVEISGSFDLMTDMHKIEANGLGVRRHAVPVPSSKPDGQEAATGSLCGQPLTWLMRHLLANDDLQRPDGQLSMTFLFKRASSPYNSLYDRPFKRRVCCNCVALFYVTKHMLPSDEWQRLLRSIVSAINISPISLPSVNFLHGCYLVLLTLLPASRNLGNHLCGGVKDAQLGRFDIAGASEFEMGCVRDRFLEYLDFYYDCFREPKKRPRQEAVIYWQHEFASIMENVYNRLRSERFEVNKLLGLDKRDSNTAAYSAVNFRFLFNGGVEELDSVSDFLRVGLQSQILEKMGAAQ